MKCQNGCTGWSINNRTILNCSHFLARRFFSNPFSPKWSIHTGKLSQQHEFVMTSFGILVWCHFVSPYNMGGSANSVLCRGRHFWQIARVNAHWICASPACTERNSLYRHLKTWGSAGAWGSARQTVSIFAFFRPLSRSASGRSGFASKAFLPLEMSWPFGPWSFGIAFQRVQAVLLFKLNLRRNSLRYYPSNFTEMTASTQNIICWTVHMVGWHKVTSNQNNKWCIGELMLLS